MRRSNLNYPRKQRIFIQLANRWNTTSTLWIFQQVLHTVIYLNSQFPNSILSLVGGQFSGNPPQMNVPPAYLLQPQLAFSTPYMYFRPPYSESLPSNLVQQYPLPRPLVSDCAGFPRTKGFQSQRNNVWEKAGQLEVSENQGPSESKTNSSSKRSRRRKKKTKSDINSEGLIWLFIIMDLLIILIHLDNSAKHATNTLSDNSVGPKSYSEVLQKPAISVEEHVVSDDPVSEDNVLNPVEEDYPPLNSTPLNVSKPAQTKAVVNKERPGILLLPHKKTAESTRSNNKHQHGIFQLDLGSLTLNGRNSSAKKCNVKVADTTKTVKPAKSEKKSPAIPVEIKTMSIDASDRKPKYSKLKKVILEERRKRQQQAPCEPGSISEVSSCPAEKEVTNQTVHDTPQERENKVVNRVQPVSKPSAMSTVCNADFSNAVSSLSKEDADAVCRRLHRRRFREYCNQVLGAALDDVTYQLLTMLGSFQQRQYEQNPMKAKLRRRYVCGLREAVKHIQLGKAKCIILAPNIERIQGKGGLDDLISLIISECAANNVPIVYALGRVALGRACSKPSPVSSVAIISQAGAEEKFKETLELAQRARESYIDLVKMAVVEQAEQREQASKQSLENGNFSLA